MHVKKINLDELNQKSFDEVIAVFLSISKHYSQVEFRGSYHVPPSFSPYPFEKSNPAVEGIFLLPWHINTVIFSGTCVYTDHSRHKEGELGKLDEELVIYQERRIGNLLPKYMAALPPSVTHVFVDFDEDFKEIERVDNYFFADLVQACGRLQSSVKYFGIRNAEAMNHHAEDYGKLIQLIQDPCFFSFEKNRLGKCQVPKKTAALSELEQKKEPPPRDIRVVLAQMKALPNKLTHLSLAGNELYSWEAQTIKMLSETESLPPGLKVLNVSSNFLNHMAFDTFMALNHWWNTHTKLESLIIANNKLSSFSRVNVFIWLNGLSQQHLDLSENGFMCLNQTEFDQFVLVLPNTLRSIKIFDAGLKGCPFEEILLKYERLANGSIETLDLSDSNCLGLEPPEFIRLVIALSKRFKCINLSGNPIFNYSEELLVKLFSNLGDMTTKLILNRIGLRNVPLGLIQLLSLHLRERSQVKELDIADNGWEGFCFTALNEFLNAFPDILLHFGPSHVHPIHDGSLIVRSPGLKKPAAAQFSLRHQSEFAEMQLLFSLLMKQKQVAKNTMQILLGFLYEYGIAPKLNKICKTNSIVIADHFIEKKPVLSAITPVLLKDYFISNEKKEDGFFYRAELILAIKESIQQRFLLLKSTDTTLDLSHLSLGWLDHENLFNIFNELFEYVPSEVMLRINYLDLRKNNFQANKMAFSYACAAIPARIKILDLDGHDFHLESNENVKQLFKNLRADMRVSLHGEKPITMADHMILRNNTEKINESLTGIQKPLGEKTCYLFDVYRGKGSKWERFFHAQWNRDPKNLKIALGLGTRVKRESVRNFKDLEYEAQKVLPEKPKNKRGAFMSTLYFLSMQKEEEYKMEGKKRPHKKELEDQKDEPDASHTSSHTTPYNRGGS